MLSQSPKAMEARLVRRGAKLQLDAWLKGEAWYPREAAIILGLDNPMGLSVEARLAGYAGVSPRCRVQTARRKAESLFRGEAPKGLVNPIVNALFGITYGVAGLSGPKVCSFAANLLGCERSVTVDVHAARIAGWEGDLSPKGYGIVARCYQRAADRLGVSPRTLQAALWIAERGSSD